MRALTTGFRVLQCAWPGLSRLWRGQFWGLLLALVFAWGLLLGTLSTWMWPEWFRPGLRPVVWLGVSLLWCGTSLPELLRLIRRTSRSSPTFDSMGLFCQAQGEYLRGNWEQARQLLRQLTAEDATDVDAQLLLATLHRHLGEKRQALKQLDRLEATLGWSKWQLEIARERDMLASDERDEEENAAADSGESATRRSSSRSEAA
ncbi:MAG: tetratricopeptide repeat protein [Planctomycetales bacterium]|nr:tetratricopeptide repeat protein [Planctomycetales bacterium]